MFASNRAALAMSLALAATAGSTHAQDGSSVRVYGILDASFVSIGNPPAQGDRKVLHSGSLQTSRLGFTAREDLGGGLSAVIDLLAGPAIDTGLVGGGTRFFNLGASVGLSTRDWGTVDAGYLRNSTIFVAFATDLSGYGLANYGVTSNLQHHSIMTNGVGGFYENTLRYRTPNFSGLRGEVTHSFGDEALTPGRSNNEFTAMNVQYTSGPLYLGAGYSNYATRTTARNDDAKSSIFGGTYDFGTVKVGAHAIRTSRPTVTQRGNQASVKYKPMGEALELDMGWGTLSENTAGTPHTRAISMGATYHLSKRTDIYALAVRIDNRAKATRGLFFYGHGTVAAGGSSQATGVGLRHAF